MIFERNSVYKMDCLDGLREMIRQGKFVECVITDPPYLTKYCTRRREDKDHKFCKTIKNDDNPQLIVDLMPLLYDVMKDNTPLYMFCNSDKVDFFKQQIEKYFTVKNIIVWDKGNHTAGDLKAQFGKRYEFIIYANKGRAVFNEDVTRFDDIWHFARVSGKNQIHQNQKPTALISRMISQHTKKGDLILDPFMGSCATAVAAYRLKRDYVGFEIAPDEYEAGQKWLETIKSQITIFDFI